MTPDMDHVVELSLLDREGELESVIDRAELELSQDELRGAVAHAHTAGQAAGSRAMRRWIVALAVASLVVAAVVAEAWFVVVCGVLGLLYGLPVYLAASTTARRDEEKHAITRRLQRHARGERLESDDELAVVWPATPGSEPGGDPGESEGGAPLRRRASSAAE